MACAGALFLQVRELQTVSGLHAEPSSWLASRMTYTALRGSTVSSY